MGQARYWLRDWKVSHQTWYAHTAADSNYWSSFVCLSGETRKTSVQSERDDFFTFVLFLFLSSNSGVNKDSFREKGKEQQQLQLQVFPILSASLGPRCSGKLGKKWDHDRRRESQ
jgi:hypothetical protein